MDTASGQASCGNCATGLHGEFCHRCGQSAHSPVRSFGHAVEEVFESFWHLDGRIFRTLRRLLPPGRLAADYLRGHRVRYVAPMRLFVILSVLTFFVARLVVHVDAVPPGQLQQAPGIPGDFKDASDAAEVERIRLALRGPLENSREAMPQVGQRALDTALEKIDQQAQRRRKELAPGGETTTITLDKPSRMNALPEFTPLQVDRLGARGNAWLATQQKTIANNLPRIAENPQLLINAFLASVPTVLFVLVPLFALLLKLIYLGSGRVYLEHLVVALYSHAYLCLALLGVLLLSLLGSWLAAVPGTELVLGLASVAILAWMPLYLLLMQKHVYAQSWGVTALRFAALGTVYFSVVAVATSLLMITSLARV